MKRNGGLLTCFVSRAVDIETTKSMETDSFILTLRRFIARRGNVRTIRSDNGSNFVGAERELEKSMEETNHSKIQRFMLNRNADWIVRKRNPPLASHMGGVWERQSRFARSILSSFLRSNRKSLDEESLNTLLTEVEAIINSRPSIVEIINDANSEVEISSSHLLPMKRKVVMPPPGVFGTPHLYCKKLWRRVQHISNEFWSRWRKEFLATLQERQKWLFCKTNFKDGDIVILKEVSNRNKSKLTKVIYFCNDENGHVRSVQLYVGASDSDQLLSRVLVRPIDKIAVLVEMNEVQSPIEEP